MGVILNGKELSEKILSEVALEVESLKKRDIFPKLCVILVGDNPASVSYVNMKHRACERTGIKSQVLKFGDDISQSALLCEIERLNNDKSVSGILVQLPLPKHISTDAVLEAIEPKKDVDGFHPYNVGRLVAQSMSNSSSALNSSLGAPCGDFGNLGRFADSKVQSHAPNSQKTPQLPPQILELDSNKNDSSDSSKSTSDSRGSILEIKSGFCETSDKDKTKVYRGSELKQSTILAHPTGCKALAEAKKTNTPN